MLLSDAKLAVICPSGHGQRVQSASGKTGIKQRSPQRQEQQQTLGACTEGAHPSPSGRGEGVSGGGVWKKRAGRLQESINQNCPRKMGTCDHTADKEWSPRKTSSPVTSTSDF